MSVFPVGEEKAMSEYLLKVLEGLHTEDIYKWWDGGIHERLFEQSGFFNNTPLANLIEKIMVQDFPKGPQRKIVVGAVDINSGSFVTFTEKDYPDKLVQGVVSSASIPFIFPHRLIDDYVLMDGGTVWNTNIISAIDRCREQVDDDSQIVLDILMC